MSFIVSKVKGKLQFRDLDGFQSHNPSTYWCIQKADFNEIKIYTHYYEKDNNDYIYSKNNNYNYLVPDFNFHSWPQSGINDYDLFVKDMDKSGSNNYEINKAGWIGNIKTNIMRNKLLEIGNNNPKLFDFLRCIG